MDFADLTDTPRKQGMLGGTIFFMLVFPIYFGIISSLKSTGNYRLANIIFLVIGLPLIMYILLVKFFFKFYQKFYKKIIIFQILSKI